jgi:hypothetical protein
VARRQIFDPSALRGAAMTALCGGQEDPSKKLRSEGGIKVIGGLGVSLSGRAFVAS